MIISNFDVIYFSLNNCFKEHTNYFRYELRALIHNKNAHFTATLIKPNNKLYIYDDQRGIREVRTSGDGIEMGIYTQIYTFH